MEIKSRLVFEEATLGIPGLHSIGQYDYATAKPGLPPHQHRGCVEISLLVKGYQSYQVGGKIYHVKGGEQYISLPGEIHDTGSEPQEKGILYWLILNVTKQRDKFLFLAPPMAHKLTADLLNFPLRHFAASYESRATLDKAFKALQKIRIADECTGIFRNNRTLPASSANGHGVHRPDADDSLALMEAVSHLVYYILQTIQASRSNPRPLSPPIQASLDFMKKNERAWLNVAVAAEHVHLSESYFKILFREEIGLPPAEYMLHRKVDAAKVLLRKHPANVTEVAYSLGFSSSQYFATVFKRFTSRTPSEFISERSPELTFMVD
ncbi:MAG: AraC family transcriptional regulator [Methylacidiphilales bacterium]|nr:AraC family transcriptional regulator [Candidatus Methylacidiphilales bacterium]